MSEVRLQVKNLCKNFGITKAVQNVSFNVNKGEVHALIGENGSGKSTLTNILTGIYSIGSGTYVSYEGGEADEMRPKVGLLLSYYSEYLFPKVYDGIESAFAEKGYGIEVAVTKNRLNDEAIYLEGLLKRNVSGLIIEGTRSAFPNPNIRLYREIKKRNIPTLFIHNHYENQTFDSVEMSDERAAYELTKILIEHGHRRIGGIFKYDEIAEHYIEFLTERGISVPRDLSLVSFDDAELQQEQAVKLLSVIHPQYKLGRITAKNLLRMMDDPAWQEKNYSYRFPVKMNDGNSIRKL